MGDRQSVEALQWLAYIGLTRNNIVHAGNGREVHFDRLPHLKVDGYCRETNEVFDSRVFLARMSFLHAQWP